MRLSVQACTHRSTTHTDNEDRVVVGADVLADAPGVSETQLFAPGVVAVLDGLGGHVAGDVASGLAARVVADGTPPSDPDAAKALIQEADKAVHAAVDENPTYAGMGTTVAMLAFGAKNGEAVVANVGDSAVLALAGGTLTELSVSDRIFGGALRQCLGASPDAGIVVHTSRIEVAPGDCFLLATDGLTDVAPASAMEAVLRENADDAAARLLAMVDDAGSPDDVAIVVVRVLDD